VFEAPLKDVSLGEALAVSFGEGNKEKMTGRRRADTRLKDRQAERDT
jgi:hypothetical protein